MAVIPTHHPFSLFILGKRKTKPNQTKTLSLSLSSVLVTELQFGLSFTVPLQAFYKDFDQISTKFTGFNSGKPDNFK
nr:hypothetical protein CFP56_50223 [Quercus suber]